MARVWVALAVAAVVYWVVQARLVRWAHTTGPANRWRDRGVRIPAKVIGPGVGLLVVNPGNGLLLLAMSVPITLLIWVLYRQPKS